MDLTSARARHDEERHKPGHRADHDPKAVTLQNPEGDQRDGKGRKHVAKGDRQREDSGQ